MYQMLAYAVRNNSNEVKLFYPSTVATLEQEGNISYDIIDELAWSIKEELNDEHKNKKNK